MGVRPGPRIFSTGYMMEWERLYYKGSVAVSSAAHLEMELERAKVLQHDLIKSYVRLPDLQQKRVVEFAHGIGIAVASHEIYPAAFVGVDSVEHTGATSRRGYSPKIATLQRSYEDVIQILGKSRSFFCPTLVRPARRSSWPMIPACAMIRASISIPNGFARSYKCPVVEAAVAVQVAAAQVVAARW